jgi:hypothetical protein
MPRGTHPRIQLTEVQHFVCKCGYVSKSKTGIRLHRRVAHGEDTDTDTWDLGGATDGFLCRDCNAAFANTSQLAAHIKHKGHFT